MPTPTPGEGRALPVAPALICAICGLREGELTASQSTAVLPRRLPGRPRGRAPHGAARRRHDPLHRRDGLLDIGAIAETYWQLHLQHRTAWTHELDLRPFKEPF